MSAFGALLRDFEKPRRLTVQCRELVMGYNPFGTVSSYKEMLAKISVFTLVNALGATALVSFTVASIGNALRCWPVQIPLEGVSISLGIVSVAFAWTLIARLVKLHDRVSDVFGLRKRFDIQHTLKPMATGVGVSLSPQQQIALKYFRRKLMREVFYKYASGGEGKAVIDEHYVTLALDQWAWFWIILEGMVTWTVAGIILMSTAHFVAGAIVLGCVAAAALLLIPSWQASIRYAQDQICLITQDQTRHAEIAGIFNALPGQGT